PVAPQQACHVRSLDDLDRRARAGQRCMILLEREQEIAGRRRTDRRLPAARRKHDLLVTLLVEDLGNLAPRRTLEEAHPPVGEGIVVEPGLEDDAVAAHVDDLDGDAVRVLPHSDNGRREGAETLPPVGEIRNRPRNGPAGTTYRPGGTACSVSRPSVSLIPWATDSPT